MEIALWVATTAARSNLASASVTVGIIVEAMRYRNSDQVVRVMEAEAGYVAVDENRKPIPIEE
jgi:acyl-CoA hydrolase